MLKNLEIKKLIRNICKDVHYNISVGAKDYKQKIRRKIVAYMLALEVEDLGTVDLTTSLQFRQYTSEVQTTNNTLWRFDSAYISAVQGYRIGAC